MGSNESDKASKEAKEAKEPKTPSSQDQPSSLAPALPGTINPEWPAFQGYSPIPPHGYMTSTPQGHPYMWGVQHHLMPPPHPYVAMYPHGGMYGHPSMPPGSYPFSPFVMPPNGIVEASNNTHGNIEVDNKPSEVKEKLPIKRSKGSLGSLNINNEPGKTSGTSANGVYSKSSESGIDGSSDGSDTNSQNDSPVSRKDTGEVSENGVNQTMPMVPITGASGPTTNLNIGMEYWGGATSSGIPAMRGQVSSPTVPGAMVTNGSHDSFQSQIWDERELKRQKRKQSNRESARRSRLRKQAECDELAQRADLLKEENAGLRAEINRLGTEYEELLAQNASLKESLGEVPEVENLRPCRSENGQHSEEDESVQNAQ